MHENSLTDKESLEAFRKDLNSIIYHYVSSGFVAENTVRILLKELVYHDEKTISEKQSATSSQPEAFILVNCELGYEQDLIQELRKLPFVYDVKSVFGVYDFIVRIRAKNEIGIRQISAKIRSIINVKSTLTMMVIEN